MVARTQQPSACCVAPNAVNFGLKRRGAVVLANPLAKAAMLTVDRGLRIREDHGTRAFWRCHPMW